MTVKKCEYKNSDNKLVTGDFYGFFQFSEVLRPEVWVGGHQGGERAYPLAVVMEEDGINYVDPIDIRSIYEVDFEQKR